MRHFGPVLRVVFSSLLGAAVAVSVVSAMAQGPYPPGPPRPGQPGFGQPPRPGQPQMTPYQKQQLEQENRAREKAEQLRQQGKYDEAIRAAQEYVQLKIRRTHRSDYQDQQWVNQIRSEQQRARMTQQATGPQGSSPGAATGSSSEEKKLREEADRLSRDGQHDQAVKAAEKCLQLKRGRTGGTDAQDQQWLTNLRNKKTSAEVRARENAALLGTTDPAYANLTRAQAQQMKDELEWREKAERRRGVGRYRYAVQAAKEALDLKQSRTGHLEAEDRQWLLRLQNEAVGEDNGLSTADADDIVKMEYRDKWFDYSEEVHDGGEMARAIQAAQEMLGTKREQLGDVHPEVVAARKDLKDLQEKRAALVEDMREYMLRRYQCQLMGDFRDAAIHASGALDAKRQVYGTSDLTVAIAAAELGRILQLANSSLAPKHFQESLDIILRIYGEDHWRSRDARVALRDAKRALSLFDETRRRVCGARARTARSAKLLERGWYYKASEIAKEDESFLRTRFPGPSSCRAACLANLAALHRDTGEYAESVKVQRQALAMLRELYGEEHPEYIDALNHQFTAYVRMGDVAKAGETAWSALGLGRKIWKPTDREYVVSATNMGEAYLLTGRLNDARAVLEWVVLQRPNRDDHRDLIRWAAASHHLGGVYARLGLNAAAKRSFTTGLEARRNVLGEVSMSYLESLTSLAKLNMAAGDYAEAESQFAAVLQKSETPVRKKRPLYARHLANLAELHQVTGSHDKAVVELEESLAIFRDNLDATFGVLSERQQLAMTRGAQRVLFAYLWSAAQRGGLADDAYGHVLIWKGAVFARQRQVRAKTGDPEADKRRAELQETSRQLATLALMQPGAGQLQGWKASLKKLTEKKEALESQPGGADERGTIQFQLQMISRQMATLAAMELTDSQIEQFKPALERLTARKEALERQLRGIAPVAEQDAGPISVGELQAALPDQAVLVDFLEYDGLPPDARPDGERKRLLTAFIVRKGAPIVRVELGPAEAIEEAGTRWRELIVRKGGGTGGIAPDLPQKQLRKLLWEPLEEHLGGAGIVLLSPDGVTARLPLAALPGREPQKYLIEERALVVVPVPRLLPALLSEDDAGQKVAPSLMLVGDVDFGAMPGTTPAADNMLAAAPSRAAVRGGDLHFGPLPGTARELTAIAELHRKHFAESPLEEVRGAEATEARLRTLAPEFRCLHLATHGFFAPDQIVPTFSLPSPDGSTDAAPGSTASTLGFHPGLLSGVALAGANRSGGEATSTEDAAEVADDGVMTALEVASLNLGGVELAVLSACETGLGKTAAGEGVLGLQRAFQMAGADTTVTSLWKVDDSATQALMVEFYRLLWEENLGKLESLRQAQLTMLQRYDPGRRELRPRGLTLLRPDQPAEESSRLSPYFWAAFVLGGDWR